MTPNVHVVYDATNRSSLSCQGRHGTENILFGATSYSSLYVIRAHKSRGSKSHGSKSHGSKSHGSKSHGSKSRGSKSSVISSKSSTVS